MRLPLSFRRSAAGTAVALGVVLSPAALAAHDLAIVVTRGSPHQPEGEAVLAGARLAADRINAAGGVNGEPVRLVPMVEDCTRRRAMAVAEALVLARPAVVIGHSCAGAALAAAEIYARAGILYIAPGVRQARLTAPAAAGPLVFRLAGRDDRLADDMARFITEAFPGDPVAIVADRTLQASALAASVQKALLRRGGVIAHVEKLESSEKSYDVQARRVAASGAKVVMMPAQPVELGVLVAGLRGIGVTAPVVGSDILAVPAIVPVARSQGERLILMMPWSGLEQRRPPVSEPRALTIDGLQARMILTDLGDAAVTVWASAATSAQTVEPPAVAAALRRQAAETAVGRLAFDAAGDAVVPSYLPYVWRDDGLRPRAAERSQQR